ncbi:MAG: MBL fold metallo-hydrolase [Solirubrobacteraceae bacterium]|nr:MBL fold metallo-hydrolase [Solirubrobacteraceae bacterium]
MGDALAVHDVVLVRADNPGPLTLTGTNTWIVGRDPCWIIDPGPALEPHLDLVATEAERRGGAGGIAVTHDHFDHAEGTEGLRVKLGGDVPVAASRLAANVRLSDGDEFGPLRVIATPGHATDHLAFATGRLVFTGDAVVGTGTAFLMPDPGSLQGYLAALERLRALEAVALCPGHGPVISDPRTKLDEYIAHRQDREDRLVAGLAAGRRTVDELLDAAWDDVADDLRPVAAVTLATHLDKLADEGRLPDGVERPTFSF